MPPKIGGILETCLYVDDLPASRAFYERVFGFAVLVADARICAFDAGPRSVLILFKRGSTLTPAPIANGFIPAHDAEGPQHFAFAIAAEAWDDWKAHLGAQGIAVESEVDWPQGGRSLYFRDPDRHLGELATPGLWRNW